MKNTFYLAAGTFVSALVICAALPCAAWATEPAAVTAVSKVATKVEHAVVHGAKAAASGVEHGAQAAARGVKTGLHAAASGVERGAKATARAAQAAASKVQP